MKKVFDWAATIVARLRTPVFHGSGLIGSGVTTARSAGVAGYCCLSEEIMREHRNAIELVERKGLRVHYYLPTIGCRDDRELRNAVEKLRLSGYIITNPDGSLFGKVATVNPAPEEEARRRRSRFKVVK